MLNPESNSLQKIYKTDIKLVFQFILSAICFYLTNYSAICLCFDLLNYYYADQLSYSNSSSMRMEIAILIIAFPCYFYLTAKQHQLISHQPEVANSRIKKWLCYFTLFLASIILITNIITLLYYFLDGDWPIRFLLKVASVFIIVGLAFLYYCYDVKLQLTKAKLYFFSLASLLLIIALISDAFYISGSPFNARKAKFDEQRINALNSIQTDVISFWRKQQKLPVSLQALTNDISGYKAPLDPETNTPYVYQPLSALSFKLCATFQMASSNKTAEPWQFAPDGAAWNWQHSKGYSCFERKIDPKAMK